MIYVLAVAVVFVWVMLIGVMVRAMLHEVCCPECGGTNIESVDLHTSVVVVDGQRVPAAWMYRRCRDCRAHLKWDVGQNKWVELDAGEWDDVIRQSHEIPQ